MGPVTCYSDTGAVYKKAQRAGKHICLITLEHTFHSTRFSLRHISSLRKFPVFFFSFQLQSGLF
jgi:hypothetical protein